MLIAMKICLYVVIRSKNVKMILKHNALSKFSLGLPVYLYSVSRRSHQRDWMIETKQIMLMHCICGGGQRYIVPGDAQSAKNYTSPHL